MNPKDLALSLAAGGARGAYHSGAMLFLAEQGLRFTFVSGASIGSLNASFYAQGDGSPGHVEELIGRWRAVHKLEIMRVNATTVLKVLSGIRTLGIDSLTSTLLSAATGDLPILDPRPVASLLDQWINFDAVCNSTVDVTIAILPETSSILDIVSGPWRQAEYARAVELGPARMRAALLAAMAIPLAFPSQELDGRKYADAGLADGLPAQVLYKRGLRRIVSIFLADGTIQNRADFADCIMLQIRPSQTIDLGLWTTFDFTSRSIDRLIDLGYRDARESYSGAEKLVKGLDRMLSAGRDNQRRANLLPDRRKGHLEG